MLANILTPTSGRAAVLGKDSRRLSPRDLQGIGYVSENQNLPEWMTVGYFLRYLKPFYPTWDDALAEELIREFELPKDRRLSQLSRGMKMKAALASSLAYHPRLIILDEPFSGLDPLVRDEFTQGLVDRAGDTTVFVSSHDLAELESFASHVGFLHDGRMQFSEEITALSGRFKEIELILEREAELPGNWPPGWLKPQVSAALLRFVDTQFDQERTPRAIGELFPGATNVAIHPMPLREIFVALAKSNRKAA